MSINQIEKSITKKNFKSSLRSDKIEQFVLRIIGRKIWQLRKLLNTKQK